MCHRLVVSNSMIAKLALITAAIHVVMLRTRRRRVWLPAMVSTRLGTIDKQGRYTGPTFHDLRRTSATGLVAAGVDVKTAQSRLGHSQVRLTLELYAQAVAHSALGHIAEGERVKAAFLEAKRRVPESRRVHNNTVKDLLEIAEAMLDGELEYRRGNYDVAFAHLRRSVELDDALPYDEPWGWMQPTRHALGALLLEQGRITEAEAIYRSDLGLDGKLSRACQHPDNLWSLHGLHECLTRRGEAVEAALIKQRLDLALARSEVPVKASCFCRMKVAA